MTYAAGRSTGANVTIPYKEAAARAASVLDPIAAEIGAVNCLTRSAGALSGSNTDAPALLHLGRSPRERSTACRS